MTNFTEFTSAEVAGQIPGHRDVRVAADRTLAGQIPCLPDHAEVRDARSCCPLCPQTVAGCKDSDP